MPVDYRKILTEYMKGVVRSDGVTMVEEVRDNLTGDERNALYEVYDTVRADRSLLGYWVMGARR